jgi:glycine/D-amino acid oxidase-like deaminating enzyme
MAFQALKNAISRSSDPGGEIHAKGRYEAIVVGDGLAALSCAYYLVHEQGMADIAVWGTGQPKTRWAPVFVGGVGPDPLIKDGGRQEVELWRQLVRQVGDEAQWQRRGHLWLAFDAKEEAVLRSWRERLALDGGVCRWLKSGDATRLCPPLAGAAVRAALYITGGGWAGDTELAQGLIAVLRRRGVFAGNGPAPVVVEGGRVRGVRSAAGLVQCQRLVVACGEVAQSLEGVKVEPVDYVCALTEPLPPALGPAVLRPAGAIRAVQVAGGGVYLERGISPGRDPLEELAAEAIGSLPGLRQAALLRHWTQRRWRFTASPANWQVAGGLWCGSGWEDGSLGMLKAGKELAAQVAQGGGHAS